MADQDYQVVKLAVMGEVKTHFRPEFINRIDEIVVFHVLNDAKSPFFWMGQFEYRAK